MLPYVSFLKRILSLPLNIVDEVCHCILFSLFFCYDFYAYFFVTVTFLNMQSMIESRGYITHIISPTTFLFLLCMLSKNESALFFFVALQMVSPLSFDRGATKGGASVLN